jgi:hypothetical protein
MRARFSFPPDEKTIRQLQRVGEDGRAGATGQEAAKQAAARTPDTSMDETCGADDGSSN